MTEPQVFTAESVRASMPAEWTLEDVERDVLRHAGWSRTSSRFLTLNRSFPAQLIAALQTSGFEVRELENEIVVSW